MLKRESTTNVRSSWEEKAAWKAAAPNGDVSKWLRSLAEKEIKRLAKQ